MLTQAYVKRLFDYDPLVGVLTWRIRPNSRIAAGSRAGAASYHPNGKSRDRHVCIKRKHYPESKIIWVWMTGIWPQDEVDHIDVDPFNNVWLNLREAKRSNNGANRHTYRKGLKWVHPNGKRFYSQVRHQRINHYVGTYDTEQEAHDAAYLVAQRLHGSFVRR
jgi:hypothetical protein